MGGLATSFEVPYKESMLDSLGILTRSWEWFFRSLWERLYPLGIEKSFTLLNDQSMAAPIDGMIFNFRGVSQAIVEYLVQRITTGTGATDLVESGILIFTYNPIDEAWSLDVVHEETPDDAGIEFSITDAGQVEYTTTSITGDSFISNVFWRARTLGGKNKNYSAVGKR